MKCLSKGQGCRAKIHKCPIQQELRLITFVFVSGKQSEQLCLRTGQMRQNYSSSSVKRYPRNGHNLQCADFFFCCCEKFSRIRSSFQVILDYKHLRQLNIEHILSSVRSEKDKTSNSLVTAFFVKTLYMQPSKCCFQIGI